MQKWLTADQFVAGVLAELALKKHSHFELPDTELDKRFEGAFIELLDRADEFEVSPIFSFFVDDFHGDSTSLRETLLSAKEKKILAFHNPTHQTFEIKLSKSQANHYLENLPLPKSFFVDVVRKHFQNL
jgi:hypothetical protein